MMQKSSTSQNNSSKLFIEGFLWIGFLCGNKSLLYLETFSYPELTLNRNWDANWQANWTGVHCWNYRFITAGTGPGSEPETQALATFLIERKIIALISYHSAGLGIFPGGWPNDQKSIDLAFAVSQVSPYSYPPVETDCQFTGQLIDWASAQGIAAVDIELSNHIDSDLFYNLKILEEFLKFDMFIATPTTLVR